MRIALYRFAVALVATLLAAIVGLFVFRLLYEGRIYPVVVVGDVNVGGLSVAEAEDRLVERAMLLEHELVTFQNHDRKWQPTLSELGVTVKVTESIVQAQQLGQQGDAASRLAFTYNMLDADPHVPLRTELDQHLLNRWFDELDQQVGQAAVNATIVIDGASVTISPETTGVAVDRDTATEQILGALSSLQPVAVQLPTLLDEPEFTRANLSPVNASLDQLISTSVQASFEDETWTIAGVTIAPYLVVETIWDDGAPAARLDIDTAGLATELRTTFADQINREPVDAEIGWDDGLVVLSPSTTGATLRAGAFAEAVADSFRHGHTSVEIPLVNTSPVIDGEDLDALGIDTLLGQGDSNFEGGIEGRDANVVLATELMNGTLIAPGGTFSFNDAIGVITYERGFQEALVVQGDGVGRDAGGGVCQVSTTVFRAALNAGLPITEWYAHSYRLPNYERDDWGPGFDASILQYGSDPAVWPDFEFENNTDGWLYVESYIDYPHVHVNLYSTDDGREVYIDPWTIEENAFGFTRVVQDAAGAVMEEQSFTSYYRK